MTTLVRTALPFLTMSTAHKTHQSGRRTHSASSHDSPSEFERHIWHNSTICNNCFTRCKRSTTFERDDWGNRVEVLNRTEHATDGYASDSTDSWGEQTVRITEDLAGLDHWEDGTQVPRVVDVEPIGVHGYRPQYRYRTTCGECGSVRLLAQEDDLSKLEMLQRVPALVGRLEEQGIAVSERVTRRTVRKLKSVDRIQGKDREIFERAVKLGIRQA